MKVEINWDKFDSKLYAPLVHDDIPDYSPGTIAYDDFWDEQDNRCLNGYKPTRFMPKITKEHYFYLNNAKIELLQPGATRKSAGHPFYRELDRRLFNAIDGAKKGGYGLIVGKPRRIGLSWAGTASTAHELLFNLEGKVGVAAGMENKAADFYEKIKYMFDKMRPEYKTGIIKKNKELFKIGYEYTENKQALEGGICSEMYIKTFFAKPTGFEGKSLNMVIFEEAGLFEDIIASYKSTLPCFREGARQFGTPLIYGTGGDIEKGSKGYQSMWKDHKKYNLEKVFIPAFEYYPGDGIEDKETGKRISFFDFKTGRTNQKAAYEHIMAERKVMEGADGYIKHVQSYPVEEADIFIKTSGGLLNRKYLNTQLRNLDNCPYEIKRGTLEWTTNDLTTIRKAETARTLKELDKIHFKRGSKIKFVEDENGTVVKILDPLKNSKGLGYNADIGGSDSYDEEMAQEEREHASSGSTIIYRTFAGLNEANDTPVCYVVDRGDGSADDTFYSTSLRMAVFYDTQILVEYTKIAIINYFKDCDAQEHLREKPDLEGYESKASNKYGWKVSNQYAKAIITKLLKAEINLNWSNYWFKELLLDLINYGDENTDLAMALGMCMVYKLDLFGEITDGVEDDPGDGNLLNDLGHWQRNHEGTYEYMTYGQSDDPHAIDNSMFTNWNPEKDLDKEDYQQYMAHKTKVKTERVQAQKDLLDKYGGDIMGTIIDSIKESYQ